MNKMLISQKIMDFLQKKIPDLELVIIFGSFTNEYFNEQSSDIDIAFLNVQTLSHVERWYLQEELASLLNRDIDLVDLKQINTVFKVEIIHKGNILFQKQDITIEQFLDRAYIDYLQLNDDRAEILEYYQ